MNICVLSKACEATESLSCHRVIALLRTDRDHEQKLVITRLFALSPVAVSREWCFRTFSQYPLYLSSNLFAQHCAVKLPNTQQTYDLLCLWRLHKRIKRSLMFGLSLHTYFLAKFHATLLSQSCFIEVSSSDLSSKLSAQGFRSSSSLFGKCMQNVLFLPEFCLILYQVAHKNFMVCPAEAFNPISPAFRRIEFIGFEFLRYTTLDLLSLRKATAP